MFTIKSITANASSAYGATDMFEINVTITIDAKTWSKLAKQQRLGELYGVDVGNAVYRINSNIRAYNPMVNDRARASKGLKTITLMYTDTNLDAAEALGLEVKRYKNGQGFLAYSTRSYLLEKPIVINKPELKLVGAQ